MKWNNGTLQELVSITVASSYIKLLFANVHIIIKNDNYIKGTLMQF